jgi:hypothetical protein
MIEEAKEKADALDNPERVKSFKSQESPIFWRVSGGRHFLLNPT